MSLYISNSKFWCSLALALLLLLGYSLLIEGQDAKVTHYQNQWVKNHSVVERYLYSASPSDIIIVGSSMSARLFSNEFSASATNLALASTGSLTGIRIIERSGLLPAVLLVESNIIEKEADPDLINRLFTPLLWRVKAYFQSLRFTNQPINFFISWLYRLKNSDNQEVDPLINTKLLEREVSRSITKGDYIQDLENSSVLQEVAARIKRLQQAGVNVVIFDAPIDARLTTTRRFLKRHALLQHLLPEVPWVRLSGEQHALYQTSDGTHLLPSSARAFSRDLASKLKTQLR